MYPFNFFNLVFSPVKGYTFLSFIVMKIDTKSLNITDNFFFFLFGFLLIPQILSFLMAYTIYLSLYSYGFALRSYTVCLLNELFTKVNNTEWVWG